MFKNRVNQIEIVFDMFALNLRSSLQGKDLGDDSVGEATALQVIPAHFT